MNPPPIVLLFDIDGTLIESGGSGGGALLDALKEEFGLEEAEQVGLHGRTDLGIMSELLANHDIEATPENLDRLCQLYFAKLPAELHRRGGRCLPGVEPLILQLKQTAHVHLGILTGNMPQSARQKLEHYGLLQHFAFGVHGDLAAHRPDLAKPAMDRIHEHLSSEEANTVSKDISGEQIVIIGDTPLDIELANAMNVRSLAVTTGGFEAEQLASSGASRVVENLSATNSIFKWLCDSSQSIPTK